MTNRGWGSLSRTIPHKSRTKLKIINKPYISNNNISNYYSDLMKFDQDTTTTTTTTNITDDNDNNRKCIPSSDENEYIATRKRNHNNKKTSSSKRFSIVLSDIDDSQDSNDHSYDTSPSLSQEVSRLDKIMKKEKSIKSTSLTVSPCYDNINDTRGDGCNSPVFDYIDNENTTTTTPVKSRIAKNQEKIKKKYNSPSSHRQSCSSDQSLSGFGTISLSEDDDDDDNNSFSSSSNDQEEDDDYDTHISNIKKPKSRIKPIFPHLDDSIINDEQFFSSLSIPSPISENSKKKKDFTTTTTTTNISSQQSSSDFNDPIIDLSQEELSPSSSPSSVTPDISYNNLNSNMLIHTSKYSSCPTAPSFSVVSSRRKPDILTDVVPLNDGGGVGSSIDTSLSTVSHHKSLHKIKKKERNQQLNTTIDSLISSSRVIDVNDFANDRNTSYIGGAKRPKLHSDDYKAPYESSGGRRKQRNNFNGRRKNRFSNNNNRRRKKNISSSVRRAKKIL